MNAYDKARKEYQDALNTYNGTPTKNGLHLKKTVNALNKAQKKFDTAIIAFDAINEGGL